MRDPLALFTPAELRKLRSFKDPYGIQRFLDDTPYHLADTATAPVLAAFRIKGHWGAVAKSNYSGCRYREPVYRSLRELAMSYFNIYFNMRGERTLRNFSLPVNLARFDHLDWMTTEEPIWFIPNYLCDIHHYKLLRPGMVKRLHRVDQRLFLAETFGKAHKGKN